ncbi:MAG: polymer-forming cytoskeletal protein [Roseiflexaceae bacterium]
MFGRRNPDRPLDLPLTDRQETEDLNLDLLDDLPDIIETENNKPAEGAPTPPVAQEPPAAPVAEPTWQSTPSVLGPSVTRMLQTPPPPQEETVPHTDLSSPPPRTPAAPMFQAAPPAPATQPMPVAAPPIATTPLVAAPPVAAPVPAVPSAPAAPAARPAARPIAESVIGPDDFFDGRYRSERGVRIQGNARGSIESRQYIFVEGGAQVEADLSAEDITISGDFKGKISCRRRLEVTSTGKIQGQVQTALLVVQEGGAIDGELHMRVDQVEAASEQ